MAATAENINLNESANGGSAAGNGHLTLDVSKLKAQSKSISSTNVNGLSGAASASFNAPQPQRNGGGDSILETPSHPTSPIGITSPVSFFNHSVLIAGSSGNSGAGLSKTAQANFAQTLERMRFQRETMANKPKPKDTPNCQKLNVMLDGKPLATMVMPKYEVSNANDPTKRDRMILRPDMEMKRLYHIEGLVEGMLTPNTGIEIKEKKSVFKKTTTSGTNPAVSGQQITDWLEKRGDFLSKIEAAKYAERIMTAGYIIPEKIAYEDHKFSGDAKTMYVFQSPLLWRSKYKRKPTDEEYAVFLIKYITKFGGQGDAKAEERLDQLATANHSKWDLISKAAKKQLEIMDKASKSDSKVFFIQEFGFWKSFRPSVDTEQHGMDLELKEKVMYQEARDKEIALKKARRTEQNILDEELKVVEVLKASEALKRTKASAAVRSAAIRCDLFEVLDPFLKEPEMGNPWIKDDTSMWEVPRKAPTAPEVRIWINSFSDLLKDPLGVKYFF